MEVIELINYLIPCVFVVCVCMCCVCVRVRVCTCSCDYILQSSGVVSQEPFTFSKWFADWLGCLPIPGMLVSISSALRLQAQHCLAFSSGSWGLNSGPRACMASPLLTEHPSAPAPTGDHCGGLSLTLRSPYNGPSDLRLELGSRIGESL